jgi:pyruvate kinase
MGNIKKTKIVCTIGPASQNVVTLKALVKKGMNVARLNFSHGDFEEHQNKINLIREVEKQLNIPIPIMLDTKGPEIRVHTFKDKSQTYKKGFEFSISSTEIVGDELGFSVNYAGFFDTIKVGQLIKIDDGKFICKIIKKDNLSRLVYCKAQNTQTLTNKKGVNIIGGRFNMPFLSSRDIEDITFGASNNVNYVAASFVRTASDVEDLRKLLKSLNKPDILIISKIESKESLSNIDEIIKVSDGIMVARGDLGVEVNPEEVPIIQKQLIIKCRKLGKPVIIATQMLESMQHSLMPTRAEVSDVALAIAQGADCVMLSAESASGEYPVESCTMQANIALTIEKQIDYRQIASSEVSQKTSNNSDSLANAVAVAAIESNAKLIVVFDSEGLLTMRLAKTRPIVPIVCVTSNIEIARKIQMFWGVYPYLVPNDDASKDDNKFIYLKKVAQYYKIRTKANLLLIKTKHKVSLELKEESLRIVTINE